MQHLSIDEQKLLEKFGFLISEPYFIHKKLSVKKPLTDLKQFSTLSDTEDYIKSLLRAS